MVPALFPEEEKEGLCQMVDAEIKKNKLPETKEFRWAYFVKRARENLHVVLAMSPSGDTLRLRCRNFPGLVSNTTIDWFFPWPLDALTDVATFFLAEVEIDSEFRQAVTDHITGVHLGVQAYSAEFEAVYKRKNSSTPKNYLDFINNYIKFLGDRRKNLDAACIRLEGGLATLADASEATAEL
jgi:dynein heavy chain, axonemal